MIAKVEYQKLERLMDSVLDENPNDWRALIDHAIGENESLRTDLGELLSALRESDNFLEKPPLEVLPQLLQKGLDWPKAGDMIGPYHVLKPIGSGGMGVVFLAEDQLLRRKVALKKLPPFLTDYDAHRARFLREAQLASALDHPNICTILEIVEHDGQYVIVMQNIDGKPLSELISGKPMQEEQILSVALQVASVLDVAHSKGIIHRDVKPANVMITSSGQVKVLDFGVAKLHEQTETEEGGSGEYPGLLTATGIAFGTPAYMSPEQASGKSVDFRSDLFSFGIVLYEMATGRRPFPGSSKTQFFNQIVSVEPESPSNINPEISHELERIIQKCIRKDVNLRYQSAKEIINDLQALQNKRRPVGWQERLFGSGFQYSILRIVLVAAVLITAFAFIFKRLPGGDSPEAIHSLAVLPFENRTGTDEFQYLSDGISESLINDLSQLKGLRVMSRGSAFRFEKTKDPIGAARQLKVQAVVTGRVVRHGDQITLNAELTDARDERHLWGAQYSQNLSDVLHLQERIYREIAQNLRLKLSPDEKEQVAKSHTKSGEAYNLYFKGRYQWNKYQQSTFLKSIEYYNRAIELDPTYALAYAGIGDAYLLLAVDGNMPPAEVMPKAEVAIYKALGLDDTLPEVYTSLGMYKMFYEWDWAGAEKSFLRAIELNPNYADVYHFYGHYNQAMGRSEKAIELTMKAVELDPLSLIIQSELGFAFYEAHQFDRAIIEYKKSLEAEPSFVYASWGLSLAYQEKGLFKESLLELERARKIDSDWTFLITEQTCTYARMGKKTEAYRSLKELEERSKKQFIDPGLFAMIYVALNEKNLAFEWLTRTIEEKSSWVCWFKLEPKFDPVRNDPRFATLLQKVGLSN